MPPTTLDLVPLNLLSPGQSGQVSHVMGQSDQVHRLEELGLRGGAAVEMVQGGSPCIIRLSGHKMCFRADDLLRVLVRRGAAS